MNRRGAYCKGSSKEVYPHAMKYGLPYRDVPMDEYLVHTGFPPECIQVWNDGRGPHENREFGLMRRGLKPLALVQDWKFELALRHGALDDSWFAQNLLVDYAVALPGEEWRIPRIQRLMMRRALELIEEDYYHVRMGILLGYTKEDIRGFVEETLPYNIRPNGQPILREKVA